MPVVVSDADRNDSDFASRFKLFQRRASYDSCADLEGKAGSGFRNLAFRKNCQALSFDQHFDRWIDNASSSGPVYWKAAHGSHDDCFESPESAHFFKCSHIAGAFAALYEGVKHWCVEHAAVVGAEDEASGQLKILATKNFDLAQLDADK